MTQKDINLGRFFDIATTNKNLSNGLNLQESLFDYKGDFEMIGSMLIDQTEQKTNNSFRIVDAF